MKKGEPRFATEIEYSLPEGWIWTKLGDITLVMDVDHKMPKAVDKGIPFISPKDFRGNSEIDFTEAKQISREDFMRLSRKCKVQFGDIIYSRIGTVGKVRLAPDREFGISYSLAIVRPISNDVNIKCLYYLLQSPLIYHQAVKEKRSIGVPDLGLNSMRNFRIPLIPKNEQERIVSKIEEIFAKLDAGVDALRKVKAQLRQYRESVLKYAFEGKLTRNWRSEHNTSPIKCIEVKPRQKRFMQIPELPSEWRWINLKSCCKIVAGYAFKSKDFVPTLGVPVVKIGNVSYGRFIWQDQEYLPLEFKKKFSNFVVKPNTILIALTRPITNNTLKVCLYPEDASPALLNQRVALVAPSGFVRDKFLFSYMQSSLFKKQVFESTSETLQPNLSPLVMGDFFAPMPSLEEQDAIVSEVERLLSITSATEANVSTNLLRIERLRRSVLVATFSGKLVCQDSSDEPAIVLLQSIRGDKAMFQNNRAKAKRLLEDDSIG